MEFKDLKNIVHAGEGLHVEFKLKSNHPEKIIREIVAFANSGGGTLYIGIADNKEIIGLKYPDEDQYIIEKQIEKNITPSIYYEVEKITLDNDREVLAFYIPISTEAPHHVLLEGEKRVYVRDADKSLQASKEMREILKAKHKNRNYKFQYGDKENLLMKYLDQKPEITVKKFAEIAAINLKMASRTLILLVLAGVLNIKAREFEDVFVQKG